LSEDWGQVMNLLVFFIFGMLVMRAWGQLTLAHVAYAALSLAAVRMSVAAEPAWLRGSGCSYVLCFIPNGSSTRFRMIAGNG